jgi:hypothetical protein
MSTTQHKVQDPAQVAAEAAVRHARFGALPERVHLEDTVEEQPELPDPARDAYNPDEWLVRYAL